MRRIYIIILVSGICLFLYSVYINFMSLFAYHTGFLLIFLSLVYALFIKANSSIQKAYQIVTALGFCSLFLITNFFTLPFLTAGAGMLLFFSGLVTSLILTLNYGINRWRKSSRFWWLPALLCLIFISSFFWGHIIGLHFDTQRLKNHMEEFAQIVDDIKSGAIPCDEELSPISTKNFPPHIIGIQATCNQEEKIFVVKFFLAGSGVFGHKGYEYNENTEYFAENMKGKNGLIHINGNWYHFIQ